MPFNKEIKPIKIVLFFAEKENDKRFHFQIKVMVRFSIQMLVENKFNYAVYQVIILQTIRKNLKALNILSMISIYIQ